MLLRSEGNDEGFSLLELLVVLVIMVILATVVAPNVLKYVGTSKVEATRVQMKNIEAALDLYSLDQGSYPSEDAGLEALVNRPEDAAAWNGPYLKTGKVPADGWGHAFIYHVPGKSQPYDLISLGSDGKEGGDGDAADIVAEVR